MDDSHFKKYETSVFFDQVTTSKALNEQLFVFGANALGFASTRRLICSLSGSISDLIFFFYIDGFRHVNLS